MFTAEILEREEWQESAAAILGKSLFVKEETTLKLNLSDINDSHVHGQALTYIQSGFFRLFHLLFQSVLF